MKKIVLLICSLFLLSIFSCATTKEAVKLASGDFDLTGTWNFTEVVNGCGESRTENSTVVITQDGDLVTAENKDKGTTWSQPVVDSIITIPKKKRDKVAISEYQLNVIEGADTIIGKVKWNYNGQCDGVSKVTYQRQ